MPILFLFLAAYAIASAGVLVFHLLEGGVFGFLSLLGVCLALVALASYWFRQWHERRRLLRDWTSKVIDPPSDLSAAAVCELLELADGTDEDESRTPVAIVLEMIQKRTLGLIADGEESEGPEEFIYLLVEQPGPKCVWEQALCEGLPQESLNRSELRKRLIDPESGIRQHLRKYLHDRGLLSGKDISWNGLVGVVGLCSLLLMWIGVVFSIVHLGVMWGVLWQGVVWWPGMAIVGILYSVVLHTGIQNLLKVRAFTTAGRTEVVQWRRFGAYFDSLEFSRIRTRAPEGTSTLMPFAFALDRMGSWKRTSRTSPIWREESAAGSGGYFSNPRTVGLDAAMLISAGFIVDSDMDLDFDFDIDL